MKRVLRSIVGIWAAMAIAGCASSPSSRETVSLQQDALKSSDVEAKAKSAFAQAERAYKSKKYKQAIEAYRNIKKKFPGGKAHQLAAYRLGSIYYITSSYPLAGQEFAGFLQNFPNSELAFDVTYNLAAAEYQQGHPDKSLEALRRLKPEVIRAQGPRRAEVVYQLGAQSAATLRQPAVAIQYYAAYLQLPVDEGRRLSLEVGVGEQLNQMTSVEELNALLVQVSEPSVRARIGERIAALSGPAQTPTMAGFTPMSDGPVPQSAGLVSNSSGDKRHLGVVLPLSGPMGQYGRKALDGILFAVGAFGKDWGVDFEVFAEDSAGNPAMAAQAVEKLVEEHSVIGIIGPMGWKESLAAAERAQHLGVLNLSLTGKEGISERGAYLFQNALTPRVQMENLVKHCIQEKRFHRFAILAPDNQFGEDMASEFMNVTTKLGGRVVGYETYPPDSKDFQEPAKRLALLHEPRYRKMESTKLETFIKEQQEKSRRPSKARLPPVVDFDAVFIPDGPKVAAQIAASLAYFDIAGVTLLGTSEWNGDQLYKRGGRMVEGALFPGGLSVSSNRSRQREFVHAYADAFGAVPDLLATQAFEAVELVAQAAGGSGGNRNAAVETLAALSGFESPLGRLSFDSSRIALRQLPILSLAPGGNIVEQ